MIESTSFRRLGLNAGDQEPSRSATLRGRWWRELFVPKRRWRSRLGDVLIALAIGVFQIAGTIWYSQDEPSPWALDGFAWVLLSVGPVALLFRRRWPDVTLAVTFAAAAAYAATGYPRGPAGFPAFGFAMVTAIMMSRRAFAWGLLVVAYAAFVWLPFVVPDEEEEARGVASQAENLVWLPLVGVVSEFARVRLERRAELAHVEREQARRRASEERLLITRELHDVLAHNIALINVRSGVALHLLDERPGEVRPALEAINAASEEALGELRSVLDVLSRGLGEDRVRGEVERWVPRAPTAGIRDIDGLVERTRAAGLDVRLAVEGETRPLPAGVDLAAFRIVQEGLTNVVRHAGGDARATVRVLYAPAELVVQVNDDGRGAGPAADGSGGSTTAEGDVGRGISGMRERVQALGGTFTAGPRPGRGFRVRARFPLRDEAP